MNLAIIPEIHMCNRLLNLFI